MVLRNSLIWIKNRLDSEIIKFITDHVRSTTGRLCFDSCLSICLSTPGGVPQPGPAPQVPPVRPGWGGYPDGGVPTLDTPASDLAGGYPNRGGVPHLEYHPLSIGPGRGETPTGGTLTGVPYLSTHPSTPHPHQTWSGGTPSRVPHSPQSDLAGGGTPMGGTPPR